MQSYTLQCNRTQSRQNTWHRLSGKGYSSWHVGSCNDQDYNYRDQWVRSALCLLHTRYSRRRWPPYMWRSRHDKLCSLYHRRTSTSYRCMRSELLLPSLLFLRRLDSHSFLQEIGTSLMLSSKPGMRSDCRSNRCYTRRRHPTPTRSGGRSHRSSPIQYS
jgi:hypothetical protein